MASIVAPQYFSNFATTTVNGGAGGVSTTLNPSDTSLYVPTAGLTLLPSNTPFMLLIGTPVSGSGEIVKVTAAGSNPLTIVRAQESTSAGTWVVGTNVQVMLTAGQLANVETLLQLLNQSSVATPASSGTITSSNIGVARVNPSGNVSGIILQAGTYAGQMVTVLNESAHTLTMAASGTSNVADGTGDTIAATSAKDYVWDTGTSLWYPTATATGASTADHYIVGLSGQNDTDLSNRIVIPGLSGSPDIRVAGANDDEFDQNASGAPGAWTTFGGDSPTFDTNTALSNLHMTAQSNAASVLDGILKAAPSIPYTVTAKLTDCNAGQNFAKAGVCVFDANTTNKAIAVVNCWSSGPVSAVLTHTTWTTGGAFGTTVAAWFPYLRLVVHSAGNIDAKISRNGYSWYTLQTAYAGLSNATYAGLIIDPATQTTEAFFDWIRFS